MAGFGAELRRAAEREGLLPRLVSERPEEWRLGPLTVALKAAGAAELRYARVAVARSSADPTAIMGAWARAIDLLRARSLPPDAFLLLLSDCYASLIDKAGLPAGERVSLVTLRTEVARRKRGQTRAQFAWDVNRLRRERRLVYQGRRIDLGVATGNAALIRSRVVWIEDDSGSGQYYVSFRMLETQP